MFTIKIRRPCPTVTLVCGICLLAAILLAGCASDSDDNLNGDSSAQPKATASSSAADNTPKSQDGSIKADPNPVPPGAGNGKTTISWTTKGNLGVVKVYVSDNGRPEKVVAQAAQGSTEIPWIISGGTYDFFLYAESGSNRRLIDKVQVTRAK